MRLRLLFCWRCCCCHRFRVVVDANVDIVIAVNIVVVVTAANAILGGCCVITPLDLFGLLLLSFLFVALGAAVVLLLKLLLL